MHAREDFSHCAGFSAATLSLRVVMIPSRDAPMAPGARGHRSGDGEQGSGDEGANFLFFAVTKL